MIHADPFIIHAREGEIITIKGLGDIHFGSNNSDHDRFKEDLVNRPTDKTYFIGLGDSLEGMGPAHKYFSIGNVRPELLVQIQKDGKLAHNVKPILDAELESLVDFVGKYTKPEEWIGQVSGNHPLFLLPNGIDLAQNLCVRLKHRFLGYQAYAPITIKLTGKHEVALMLFVCHGFGGAGQRWEGSGVNAYIQHSSRYDGWDIAMYGHRHDKWVKPLARIRPNVNLRSGERWVKEDVKVICQTGSYLRTLSRGTTPSYSEKGGMSPRPLGGIQVQFSVVRATSEMGNRNLYIKYHNI